MKLRKLKHHDVFAMLSWMKDSDIACYYQFDAATMNDEKAIAFIQQAQSFGESRHYAIADEDDEYLGTISLKNIDLKNRNAEYAIGLCKDAIGTGVAAQATQAILQIAFEELGLHKVYLSVFSDNARAIRFYEKQGFIKEGCFTQHVWVRGKFRDWSWYAIFNEKRMIET